MKVLCDDCGWAAEVPELEDVLAMHGKPCPSCKTGTPINDKDASILRLLVELKGGWLVREATDGDVLAMRINTARLRK